MPSIKKKLFFISVMILLTGNLTNGETVKSINKDPLCTIILQTKYKGEVWADIKGITNSGENISFQTMIYNNKIINLKKGIYVLKVQHAFIKKGTNMTGTTAIYNNKIIVINNIQYLETTKTEYRLDMETLVISVEKDRQIVNFNVDTSLKMISSIVVKYEKIHMSNNSVR